MLKAQYNERGPVPQDVIAPVEFDIAEIPEGQVLLEVLAAPINPSDVLTLTGEYGMLPPLPAVGGNEGVGRVVKLGAGVTGVEIGQTVVLPVGAGTWTTHLLANARGLIPLPPGADPRQLAMITINPPTASLLLSEFVDLKAGDWVIQNASNSGVGSYLIQLARRRGLKTANVVRRESAVGGVQEFGADVVLVDGDDLHERVAEATGGGSVRLGIDAVGGPATNRLANCLVDGGTVVNYGALSGEACHVSPQNMIFRDIAARGFWLAKWFQKAPAPQQQQVFGELTKLMLSGELKARIHATYSVAQIKEAVAAAASGPRDGKILITP